MASEKPEDCASRVAVGLGSGFLTGSLLGAISSNWGDVPVVLRNKPWPALARTGSVMMQYGTTMGLVGVAFSTVDCVSEGIRGKKDWINGSLGGAAAGAMLGLRVGRLGTAVGSAALLAVISAAADTTGGKLTGQVDDTRPQRRIYPYET